MALYPHKTKRIVKTSTGEERTFEVTRRDEARMMVLHKKSETIDMYRKDANGNPIEGEFIEFKDIVNYFDEGDTFVFNNTKPVFMVPRRRPMPRLRCSCSES